MGLCDEEVKGEKWSLTKRRKMVTNQKCVICLNLRIRNSSLRLDKQLDNKKGFIGEAVYRDICSGKCRKEKSQGGK